MSHNRKIGEFGEKLARNYLIRRGYEIIRANVKLSYQELDLVAKKGGQTVFVEVKTRVSQSYGPAENAFQAVKSGRFKRGIEMFLSGHDLSVDDIRADLITVDLDRFKNTAKIKHYKDII